MLIFMEVVLRYVFNFGFRWVEELTCYSFIYVALLGASTVSKDNEQMKIDVFRKLFSPGLQYSISLVFSALTLLFLGVLTYEGIKFFKVGNPVSGCSPWCSFYVHTGGEEFAEESDRRKERVAVSPVTLTIVAFFILLFLGMPIAFVLGVSSILYFVISGNYSFLFMSAHRLFTGINSFVLLAIPLFILAGEIINKGKISDNILNLANILVGRLRGGLGHVNVLASMVFGGLTGSALSDVAALGPIEIGMMKTQGYDTEFSTAVTAASALQGPIIPPSIPAVLIAAVTGISVGNLFLGSAIPGILVGISAIFVVYFVSKRRNYPVVKRRYGLRELFRTFVLTIPALFTIVIILGGIIGGVFTPTEAAAVAAVYVFILSSAMKTLRLDDLKEALASTLKTTAKIFLIIGCATIFSWVLAIENIPQMLANFLFNISSNRYVILLFINLIILFWGMWMDTAPSIVILIPLLLPVTQKAGIHPVHFGVIMVVNLMIGQITPPFGMTLYTAQAVGKVDFAPLVKNLIPFVLVDIIVLILITYIPTISLWLPSLLNLL